MNPIGLTVRFRRRPGWKRRLRPYAVVGVPGDASDSSSSTP